MWCPKRGAPAQGTRRLGKRVHGVRVTPPGLSPGCMGARCRWGVEPHVAPQSVHPRDIALQRPLRFLGNGVTCLRAGTCPHAPMGLRPDLHSGAGPTSDAGNGVRVGRKTLCPDLRRPDPQLSLRPEVGNCTGSRRTSGAFVSRVAWGTPPRAQGFPLREETPAAIVRADVPQATRAAVLFAVASASGRKASA